jgi:hypothetical protein
MESHCVPLTADDTVVNQLQVVVSIGVSLVIIMNVVVVV